MALAAGLAGLVLGCVTSLPDQDLRIVDAVPVAKMSADILWSEYQEDVDAANAKYWGKAIEITGEVSAADSDTVRAYVLFGQTEEFGVRANALDEAAADIVAGAQVGEKLTVKCFCAGLDGDVILKSCVMQR
jgi:hypothetical protein